VLIEQGDSESAILAPEESRRAHRTGPRTAIPLKPLSSRSSWSSPTWKRGRRPRSVPSRTRWWPCFASMRFPGKPWPPFSSSRKLHAERPHPPPWPAKPRRRRAVRRAGFGCSRSTTAWTAAHLRAATEALDVEHLHLDHVMPAALVEALDVHHRHLQLLDGHVLLGREILEVDDPVVTRELQERVEQLNQERLVSFAPEDSLEDDFGLGIRKDGTHREILPAWPSCRQAAAILTTEQNHLPKPKKSPTAAQSRAAMVPCLPTLAQNKARAEQMKITLAQFHLTTEQGSSTSA
jgi:hypothetical protein